MVTHLLMASQAYIKQVKAVIKGQTVELMATKFMAMWRPVDQLHVHHQ